MLHLGYNFSDETFFTLVSGIKGESKKEKGMAFLPMKEKEMTFLPITGKWAGSPLELTFLEQIP